MSRQVSQVIFKTKKIYLGSGYLVIGTRSRSNTNNDNEVVK